jgi:putative tricarboxylic transport membrane protein
VLAIVLGDKAEESFRQAMLASQGSLTIFFSNWLVGSIMTLGLILLFWPAVSWLLDRRKSSPQPVAAPAGAAVVDRKR